MRLGGKECTVAAISAQPFAVDEKTFSAYELRIGGFSVGEWVYTLTLSGELPKGVYEASVITDSVSPISYLFN